MSKIDELIKDKCSNGVVFDKIGNVCDVYTGGETPEDIIKEKKPRGEYIYPIYSNGIGDNALYGFAKTYRIESAAVTFSSIGTLGHPEVRSGRFTPIIRLKVIIPKASSKLNIMFLKYVLETAEFDNNKSSLPNLNANMLKSISIPIPPIEVQEEIVRILDKFGKLEAELEAELEARKSQYEFWRGELYSLNAKYVPIEDLCDFSVGGDVPKDRMSKKISIDYSIPIISNGIGENSIYGYTDIPKVEKECITVSARGTIGYSEVRNAPFYPIVRLICIFPHKELNVKFLKYYLDTLEFKVPTTGIPQLTVPMIKKYSVPIISLEEQKSIVNILDKFDKLVNDISVGLPAEIEARRRQYEYYRNKLLSFEELTNE